MTQENTLLGNIKHNTGAMLQQSKAWLIGSYIGILGQIKKLSRQKNERSFKQLLKIAHSHAMPLEPKISRRRLVQDLEIFFNQKLADVL